MLLRYFLVGITPPRRIFSEIKEMQKDIAKKYNTKHEVESLLGPHITITNQKNVDTGELREVERTIKDLCKGLRPFKIKIDGVGSFRKNEVVYLRVVKSRKLNDLYKLLSKELRKFGKLRVFGSYTPHVSMARKDIGKEELKEAIRELKKKKISYAFNVDKLDIAKSGLNQRAIVYKSFKLNV